MFAKKQQDSSNPFVKKKNILFLFTIAFIALTTSCSQYQYITITSDLIQNTQKEFICENDTVLIRYNFTGENFPVTLSIYNKLQKPLYLDWSRTVIIYNNEEVKDAFSGDESTSYIAPQSKITVSSRMLQNHFFELLPTDSSYKTKIITLDGPKKVKTVSFNSHTTPVFFSSIVTLSTQKDNSDAFYFENPFWIADIYQTSTQPSSMIPHTVNQFYINKYNENGSYNSFLQNSDPEFVLRCLEFLFLLRFADRVEFRY